jgi:hypothetical protein
MANMTRNAGGVARAPLACAVEESLARRFRARGLGSIEYSLSGYWRRLVGRASLFSRPAPPMRRRATGGLSPWSIAALRIAATSSCSTPRPFRPGRLESPNCHGGSRSASTATGGQPNGLRHALVTWRGGLDARRRRAYLLFMICSNSYVTEHAREPNPEPHFRRSTPSP